MCTYGSCYKTHTAVYYCVHRGIQIAQALSNGAWYDIHIDADIPNPNDLAIANKAMGSEVFCTDNLSVSVQAFLNI